MILRVSVRRYGLSGRRYDQRIRELTVLLQLSKHLARYDVAATVANGSAISES